MNESSHAARALYLELRALRLKVWVEDDPDGTVLDYGIALDGLRSLANAHARQLARRIRENEEELVRILLDRRDPDLDAVRKEGHC